MSYRDAILRPFRISDLAALEEWLQPHQQWHEMDGPYYPTSTSDEIAEAIARLRESIEAGEPPTSRLAIAEGGTGKLIGQVTWYWESQETNWLCVGITIFDPAQRGRGVGASALGQWTQHLFDTMPQLVRVDLRTWSGNTGMMRCAEKLGFVREACFRSARIVNGQYYDGLGYGVLREEWASLYPKGFTDQTAPHGGSPSPSSAAS